MAKELVCLGANKGVAWVALVDLADLTPRTVPIKKVPLTDLNSMIKKGSITVRGSTNTGLIKKDTYVRIAVVEYKYIRRFQKSSTTESISVFISGGGKLRFFHPTTLSFLTKQCKFIMRHDIAILPITTIYNAKYVDADIIYSDFLSICSITSLEFLLQKLLNCGAWGNATTDSTGLYTLDVYPLDRTKDKQLIVHLDALTFPQNVRRCHVSSLVLFHIGELHIKNNLFFSDNQGQSDIIHTEVDVLYVYNKTKVNCAGLIAKKVVGVAVDGERNTTKLSDAIIDNLLTYTGDDMLRDACGMSFNYCFSNNINYIDGDVIIPEYVSLSNCFNGAHVSGIVRFGYGAVCAYSFINSQLNGIVFESKDIHDNEEIYHRQITDSFLQTEINGDVDVSCVRDIFNSFTGRIAGNVLFNTELRTLSGECFTKTHCDGFTVRVKPKQKDGTYTEGFRAGLFCERAKLTVYGDKGTFEGVNVAELVWETDSGCLEVGVFERAFTLPTYKTTSIKAAKNKSFNNYQGKHIDFRLFPNLETIESRAVVDCPNLMAVIVDGNVILTPSTFARCPRLTSIFIGDAVKNITASAFDNCASVVTLYFNKNKNIEKLGRLPRFKLKPNSMPEDALAIIADRTEQLETASVIANISGIGLTSNSAVNEEEISLLQATELALLETGYNSDLSALYPVIKNCNIPLQKVSWAFNANPITEKVFIKRNETVRTFVAALTSVYSYCEAVLNYKGSTEYAGNGFETLSKTVPHGNVVLSGGGYDIIHTLFRLSGDDCWAYVIVDKTDDTIIHAFTTGPNRDEIAESVSFLKETADDVLPCAVLRYAEDVCLIGEGSWNSKFNETVRVKVLEGFIASWVPFGSFKYSNKFGTYGIDLYNGSIVAYLYNSAKGFAPNTYRGNIYDYTSRFTKLGSKYLGELRALKSFSIKSTDEYLTRLCNNEKLSLVKDYDTTMIPIASNLEKAQKLLNILTSVQNPVVSVAEAAKLFIDSELFIVNSRTIQGLQQGSKNLEQQILLTDGIIEVYKLWHSSVVLFEMTQTAERKKVTYLSQCSCKKLVMLLNSILEELPKRSSPDIIISNFNASGKDLKHYSIPQGSLDGSIINLSVCRKGSNVYNKADGHLNIGVSSVSYKACLYVAEKFMSRGTIVLFWFNSLRDAYKAAVKYHFNPFNIDTWVGKKNDFNIAERVDLKNGFIRSEVIKNTQNAIKQGRPNGYVLQDKACDQVVFDLACKQPPVLMKG